MRRYLRIAAITLACLAGTLGLYLGMEALVPDGAPDCPTVTVIGHRSYVVCTAPQMSPPFSVCFQDWTGRKVCAPLDRVMLEQD